MTRPFQTYPFHLDLGEQITQRQGQVSQICMENGIAQTGKSKLAGEDKEARVRKGKSRVRSAKRILPARKHLDFQ